MKKILLTVIFAIPFFSVEANAQMVFTPQPPAVYIPQLDPVGMYLQQQVFRQEAFAEMQKEMIVNGEKVRVPVSKSKSAPAKPFKSATAFTPAGGRILPERLSVAPGKSAEQIRQTKQMFELFLDSYEKTALSDGYSANDLAYAFEFFIYNNYSVYNDLHDRSPADKALLKPSGEPLLAMQRSYSKKALAVSPADEKMVYEQVKTLLSANPEIVKLTDRQKQEFTEMLAIITVANYFRYDAASKNNNAEEFAKAQNTSKQLLEKMFKVSADKIRITPKGLEF